MVVRGYVALRACGWHRVRVDMERGVWYDGSRVQKGDTRVGAISTVSMGTPVRRYSNRTVSPKVVGGHDEPGREIP